ncbi:MAG: AAA family ATPase [Actinomycetota bacterium]
MSESHSPSGVRPVVTLFESYGSGASALGPRVAEALGVAYLGQAYSSEQLEEAEAATEGGLVERVLQFLGRVGIDAAAGAVTEAEERERALANMRRVRDAAADGVVVLGRNATVILADHPGVIHVKLDGPLEQRVERAAAEAGITLAEASRRQSREDRVRAEMSLRLYNWDPRANDRFDLVINTGSVGLDAAIELIVEAHRVLSR